MPSPFPGMNPYLEQSSVWTDFHDSFIPALRDVIAGQIAPKYFVRIQEHLYVHEWANPFARSDLSVSERSNPSSRTTGGAGVLTAPVELIDPVPAVDHERIPYLEISTRDGRRVVTIIELLSPSNKYTGADCESFLRKRLALLNRAVHYLEIDLLRGGRRMPIQDLPPCDYYVYLNRFDRRPRAEFWPLGLRDRLPLIPIPLLATDTEARADLQDVLNTVYDRACYEHSIYNGEPEPVLSPEDSKWARQFVPDRS
jgi:Protein of unknown function (DUF4058)